MFNFDSDQVDFTFQKKEKENQERICETLFTTELQNSFNLALFFLRHFLEVLYPAVIQGFFYVIAQKPKIKEYWCLNAKFEKVFDDKAIVTFSLPFEADPRANLQKAVLAREDLLCKVDKQNGGLLINVVLQKNLAFNCDWRCTDAWYPDSSLLGLEGRFMKNTMRLYKYKI